MRYQHGYHAFVGGSQQVEPEDVPPGATEVLPGLSVLVELTLMPVSAPSRALGTFESIPRLRHWSAIGRILRAVRRQGLIERIETRTEGV